MKGLIRSSLHTRKEEKELLQALEQERAKIEQEKRLKLELFNRQTREANKIRSRSTTHKQPWGVDQRQFNPSELRKRQLEFSQQRQQHRTERERVQRQGRTRIGLDLIPEFKYPLKPSLGPTNDLTQGPHRHPAKETDLAVLEFMQEKRRKMALEAKIKAREEEEMQEKRANALANLEHVQKRDMKKSAKPKRKKKKTKKRKVAKETAESGPEIPTEKNLYKKLRDLLRSKAQNIRDTGLPEPSAEDEEEKTADRHATLMLKMEQLRTQLARTRSLLVHSSPQETQEEEVLEIPEDLELQERAATVIQRFFRRFLFKKTHPPKGTEKTLQLSAVDDQAEAEEKNSESGLSLKSFGSFLDRPEEVKKEEEEKRVSDSLDFLSRDNQVHEKTEYAKAELVDRFRKSLDEHYLEIVQKTTVPSTDKAEATEDESLLNTLRSSAPADEFSPSPQDESLGWDQHPVGPEEDSGLSSEEEKAETGQKPAVAETGGSPNDSSLPEDPEPVQPSAEDVPVETPREDLLQSQFSAGASNSARSLLDLFEPKIRFDVQETAETQAFQPPSLRIPARCHLSLNMGQVTTKVASPPEGSEESASIGSLIRGGPESPEVLSYRDSSFEQQTRKVSLETAEMIVQGILEKEINDLEELISPMIVRVVPTPVDATGEFLCAFLDLLLAELLPLEDHFMRRFCRPRPVDMVQMLTYLSTAQVGEAMEDPVEVLVPDEAFQRVCEELNVRTRQVDETSFLAPYCRLLVDVVNEALNVLRPESVRGSPPPWRIGTRDTRLYPDVTSVLSDVRELALAWHQAEVGKIVQESGPITSVQVQEEHLSTQLLRDVTVMQVLLEDRVWSDYEKEEAQVKLDLGDMVVAQLIDETVQLLSR